MDSIFIVSSETGEVLIEHCTPGARAIGRDVVEQFFIDNRKTSAEKESVLALPQCYLFHVRADALMYVCATQREIPPLLVLEFLSHFSGICGEYFGQDLTEDEIRANAVIIYQLLNEMVDGGYPYLTEPNILKEIISPPRLLTKMANALRIGSQVSDNMPDSASSNIPWRKSSVKYASNEIYVDVVEELDVTIDSNGILTNIGIYGELQANSKLSGIPDISIFFSNPQVLEDCRFHPCVRHMSYATDRVVSFVPPDGNFKLMSYKVSSNVANQIQKAAIPLYVKPQISYGEKSGRMSIMVGLKHSNSKVPEQVAIKIPLPNGCSTCDMTANHGVVSVYMNRGEALWRIGKLKRDKPACLNAIINMSNEGEKQEIMANKRAPKSSESPTFEVSFQLQGAALSGLTISSMEVSNVKYKPYKGVRYITRSGFFQIRT